jgi:hypothetical protein
MKSNKLININLLIITTIFVGLTIFYLILLVVIKNNSEILKCNEFGDYVGGILNPLFALLSTSAIIFLTYIIAKNDNKKAADSIATQKRITLNQMRQVALDNLTNKLNLFVYQLDKISMHDVKPGSFVQKVLTHNLEKNESEKVFVWLIIQYELESFLQQKYLFSGLFDNSEFVTIYNSMIEITNKLCDEQSSIKMITPFNLEKYIEVKQKLATKIGDFILSEF